MVYTAANASAFHAIYRKGISEEASIKEYLRNTGRLVTESTKEENMFQDIDCFVNGRSVSIKTMHAGAKYGNIGMELMSLLTVHQDCQASSDILANKVLTMESCRSLYNTGNWELGWYPNGKAEDYYILIGEVLRIYRKEDIQAHLANNKFLRICGLKKETKANQGGKYRYCNTISGYLNYNSVIHSKELFTTATDNVHLN